MAAGAALVELALLDLAASPAGAARADETLRPTPGSQSRPALVPGTTVISDALRCFRAVTQAGCSHRPIVTGSGVQAVQIPAFKWVNTTIGNIKNAIRGTYHAVRPKHVPRYLAQYEYRFNRRYRLEDMIPRLAWVALRTPPMPYRMLKSAEFGA